MPAHLSQERPYSATTRQRAIVCLVVAVGLVVTGLATRAVGSAAEQRVSLWHSSAASSAGVSRDTGHKTLGTKITARADGVVQAIRFYKPSDGADSYTGKLWTSSGRLLATVSFGDRAEAGWQTGLLQTPVAMKRGQTFVVSYDAPLGHYALDRHTLGNGKKIFTDFLVAFAGVWTRGDNFPDRHSWRGTAYLVDVILVVSPVDDGANPSDDPSVSPGATDPTEASSTGDPTPSNPSSPGSTTSASPPAMTSQAAPSSSAPDPTSTSSSSSARSSAAPSTTSAEAPPSTQTPAPAPAPAPAPTAGPTGAGDGSDSVADGRSINASNTGVGGAGVSTSSLTASSGKTYDSDYDNKTVSNVRFDGAVRITANNFTLKNCLVEFHAGEANGIEIVGANVRVENCTVRSPSGTSYYNGIVVRKSATNAAVVRNDISSAENFVQVSDAANVQIVENYMHDISTVSNPSGHADGLELFGLTNLTVARNRINTIGSPDGVINCSPFGAGPGADGLFITANFLDGGQETLLLDNQSTNGALIRNVVMTRNFIGGHTIGTPYRTFLNSDSRDIAASMSLLAASPQSVMWPTSGPDANYYAESGDLTPDLSGVIALPHW